MRNHQRSADQTVLGVSMPKDLKARIEQAAKLEKRSMANWAAYQLEKIVTELEAEIAARTRPPATAPPLAVVADDPASITHHARKKTIYPKPRRVGK